MRLWHSKLIQLLDGKRLCDLHMSCCNLRGKGWGKRNAAVGYLYEDPLGEDALYVYHMIALGEMEFRGYKYDERWLATPYCGKNRRLRQPSYVAVEEAYRRNIPLKGHTLRIYLNDVQALQERGLAIKLRAQYDPGGVLYVATLEGRETQYYVKM